jgi:heat shock protein HtpX
VLFAPAAGLAAQAFFNLDADQRKAADAVPAVKFRNGQQMLRAFGLYGHIQANRIRSLLLLAAFVLLLDALLFSLLLLGSALLGGTAEEIVDAAIDQFSRARPIALLAAALWFVIAYFAHQQLIGWATGASGVSRREAPQLYNALENLCISRGLSMPALQIIKTPALNAYASGLREGQYAVAVTRGLLDTLSEDELDAVGPRAHPHPQSRHAADGDRRDLRRYLCLLRRPADSAWDFRYGWSPTPRGRPRSETSYPNGGAAGRSRAGPGPAILAMAIAVAIVLISWGLSILIRFALSRSREFLADAGSAELTKNPDALVSALRKIHANARLEVPSPREAFFIDNPVSDRIGDFFSTHPSIEARIEALRRYAGAAAPT